MKFKTVPLILLCSALLFGCNIEKQISNESNATEKIDTKEEITKNPSVSLPVNIFVNSDYDKFKGEPITFVRSINDVNISDFEEGEEISFKKKYGNTFENLNLDLSKFKKLTIQLSHQFDAKEKYEKRESFVLDEDTVFVAGDYELTANEVVNNQLQFLSTDYKVGGSYEPTNEIEIAIPKEFISEHLQLKTTQKLDDEYKTIFIDLVQEK